MCGYPCPHTEWNTDGTCKVCGYQCEHELMENSICKKCGYECKHTTVRFDLWYIQSVEQEQHHYQYCMCMLKKINDDKCTFGGDGKCTTCKNQQCKHENGFTEGKCYLCEYVCVNHDWSNEDGKCTVCGYPCPHRYPETHPAAGTWAINADCICNVCRVSCPHAYDKTQGTGLCIMCYNPCTHQNADGVTIIDC